MSHEHVPLVGVMVVGVETWWAVARVFLDKSVQI